MLQGRVNLPPFHHLAPATVATVASSGFFYRGQHRDRPAGGRDRRSFCALQSDRHLDAPPPCWHRTRPGHLQTPLRTDGRHDFRRKSPLLRHHLPVFGAFRALPGDFAEPFTPKPKKPDAPSVESLEARAGIEPAHRAFAELGLTTWQPRQTFKNAEPVGIFPVPQGRK